MENHSIIYIFSKWKYFNVSIRIPHYARAVKFKFDDDNDDDDRDDDDDENGDDISRCSSSSSII